MLANHRSGAGSFTVFSEVVARGAPCIQLLEQKLGPAHRDALRGDRRDQRHPHSLGGEASHRRRARQQQLVLKTRNSRRRPIRLLPGQESQTKCVRFCMGRRSDQPHPSIPRRRVLSSTSAAEPAKGSPIGSGAAFRREEPDSKITAIDLRPKSAERYSPHVRPEADGISRGIGIRCRGCGFPDRPSSCVLDFGATKDQGNWTSVAKMVGATRGSVI